MAGPDPANASQAAGDPLDAGDDARAVLRACDAVLGAVSVSLAILGTCLAALGHATFVTALALWLVPILNLVWSKATHAWDRLVADSIRAAAFLPICTFLYVAEEGFLRRLWLPAAVMVVGTGVILGMATRRAAPGVIVTTVYALALLGGSLVVTNDTVWTTLNRVLAVVVTGLIVSLISSNLGRSVDVARRRRDEAAQARKEAETALERLGAVQQDLVEAARAAGMAEIAAGVLHNVGNVLNSVNVSAQTAESRLESARLSSLKKAADLLAEHEGDLGALLASERGRRLPEFVVKVTASITDAVAEARAELARLLASIEHINVIIATQQRYARQGARIEDFELAEIVEAALEVNQASFGRHGIEIATQVDRSIRVRSDRHRLLQIVVNLVANARQAVLDANGALRRVDVVTRLDDGGRVRIEVVDTGIGMEEETLRRLFRHGFTTRKDGHGFGLHMSAITAKELGGALTAESEGLGRGSRFILELPVDAPTAPALRAA